MYSYIKTISIKTNVNNFVTQFGNKSGLLEGVIPAQLGQATQLEQAIQKNEEKFRKKRNKNCLILHNIKEEFQATSMQIIKMSIIEFKLH